MMLSCAHQLPLRSPLFYSGLVYHPLSYYFILDVFKGLCTSVNVISTPRETLGEPALFVMVLFEALQTIRRSSDNTLRQRRDRQPVSLRWILNGGLEDGRLLGQRSGQLGPRNLLLHVTQLLLEDLVLLSLLFRLFTKLGAFYSPATGFLHL